MVSKLPALQVVGLKIIEILFKYRVTAHCSVSTPDEVALLLVYMHVQNSLSANFLY